MTEGRVVWAARPSSRPYAVTTALMLVLGWYLLSFVSPALQAAINATAALPWSDAVILVIYRALQATVFVPALMVCCKWIRVIVTRYEVRDGRLLYHHGLIFRRHDQIALQRVRDFRVFWPLGLRLIGLGNVHIVSRDETYPELTIGSFSNPLEVEKLIHGAVLEQQESVGFREFEST
jgi:uncharacterized membrane protein YdbT with pleckstrin-like domain